jgi:hypothetical protein
VNPDWSYYFAVSLSRNDPAAEFSRSPTLIFPESGYEIGSLGQRPLRRFFWEGRTDQFFGT